LAWSIERILFEPFGLEYRKDALGALWLGVSSREKFSRDGREAHVHGYGVHLGRNSLVMDAKLTSVFSEMCSMESAVV
jgi:hypothetical protein